MIALPKLDRWGSIASLLYPPVCVICRASVQATEYLCDQCEAKVTRIVAPFCQKCSEPFEGAITDEFTCANCAHRTMARWLRAALDDARLHRCRFDIIIPVPLHPTRQRERGFNQATLLAELLSAQVSIPSKMLLERVRYTTTQTALDRAERMENLHNAFRLRKNMDVRGLRVLLIDDVLTTGSTLSECARILKRAGAISVHAATAARA
jgi:ComF family protein